MSDDVTRGRRTADLIERVLTAIVVGVVTYVVVVRLLGRPADDATDPMILNAGLAYYTHQASGGLAALFSSIAGGVTYHLFKRWQRNHHEHHGDKPIVADAPRE